MTNDTESIEQRYFTFGTKAETLARLKPLVNEALIPELYFFSSKEWADSKNKVLDTIHKQFGSRILAVRSSSLAEDGAESSMAGAFLSKLNVDSRNRSELEVVIDQVVQSMTGNPRDQVLVQPMVEDVSVCGVIMTFDMVNGAPYYCIDFDDETGRTDVVTSGSGGHKSLFVYRYAESSMVKSVRVASFLRLARELETICECAALDIEFGMDKSGQVFLFQVRRIALSRNWHPVTERRAKRQLAYVEDFVRNSSKKRDGVLGSRTTLAIMPDWNPAEIIGTTPRPLAASLYRDLITKAVWCQARAVMGYREMGDLELMVIINNHPYIDVRNSFNSFLPSLLPDSIGEKLVNAWLARLEDYPEFHDKVEFDIVPTCLDFCFVDDFWARYPDVLNEMEFEAFKTKLTALTCDALNPAPGNSLDRALEAASRLDCLSLPEIHDKGAYSQLVRADYLLAQCRKLGTLPFSIVARHAFIAEALFRSAVKRGALTDSRLTEFKRSIRTVTGSMVEEYTQVCHDQLAREKFLRKYGHLRPGTYEITSLRYDERDDLFLDDMLRLPTSEEPQFTLTDDEYTSIDLLLREAELNVLSVDQLLSYARKAIASREYVKFVFTRTLSDALSMIVRWGGYHGLSRDDLSYLDWPVIARSLSRPVMDDVDRYYLDIAETSRRSMSAAHAFRLGHIIFGVRDIYVATLNRSVPNYVGIGSASGPVVLLEANTPTSLNIKNMIVCIDNADPGFDWIFTKGPSALITCFGGANSHMAVRCAEFGLPAAIGCGDQLYQRVVSAKSVELNCAEKILRPLYAE
ncbi:MAG: pyruvate, phosphate dikinase [Proteobacteria bacterium]|nr:pyruvate, phosphate dikinase [Pseudomonadota bacterium]MBU1714529.1 pyruvate, phosphate dikinase [Pseudomonadota bacterium]